MSIWEALGKVGEILEKNTSKVAIGLGGATVGAIAGAGVTSPSVEINNPQNSKISKNNYLNIIIILLIILALAFGIYYIRNNKVRE
ncbi:hypothetical protein [Methanocaldococcus sp.]